MPRSSGAQHSGKAEADLVRAGTRWKWSHRYVTIHRQQVLGPGFFLHYPDGTSLRGGRTPWLGEAQLGPRTSGMSTYLGLRWPWRRDAGPSLTDRPSWRPLLAAQHPREWTHPHGPALGRWGGLANSGPLPLENWPRLGHAIPDASSPTTARSDASEGTRSGCDETSDTGSSVDWELDERALERCAEECWVCAEHQDPLCPCCFSAEVPHREHICRDCRRLLLRAELESTVALRPPPSVTQGAARSIVRGYPIMALAQLEVALDPELREVGLRLSRMARGATLPDGMDALEHWQIFLVRGILDRVRAWTGRPLDQRGAAQTWRTLADLPPASTPSTTFSSPRTWQAGLADECEAGQTVTGEQCQACRVRLLETEHLAPPSSLRQTHTGGRSDTASWGGGSPGRCFAGAN